MSILSTELMKMYYAQTQEKIPSKGLVFHASLDGQTPNTAETGQTITTHGISSYGTFDGIPCLQHTNSTNFWLSAPASLTTATGWTISAWLAYATTTPNRNEVWCFGLTHGTAWGKCMLLGFNASNWTIGVLHGGGNYNFMTTYTPTSTAKWLHLVGMVDFVNGAAKVYINGELAYTLGKTVADTYLKSYSEVRFCTDYAGDSRGVRGTYKMAGCRIYNRVLNEAEIQQLAKEFKQEE